MQLCKSILFSKQKIPQIVAALVATTGGFCIGTMLAWSSTAIPSKIDRGNNLDPTFISWITSISMLGAVFALLPAVLLMERFGRRITIIASAATFVLGWIIVITCNSFWGTMTGRFVTGIGAGGYCMSIPVFVGEIAQDEIRSKLHSLYTLQIIFGICLTYVFGSFLSWIWLSCLCAIVPIAHIVSMKFLPESPIFLLLRGRHDEAIESLEWYRSVSRLNEDSKPQLETKEELAVMEKLVEYKKSQMSNCGGSYFVSNVLKPIAISTTLMCLQQFSGVGIAIFYALDIFETSGSNLDPKMSSIIMGVVQALAVLQSVLVVDRVGRKAILITSWMVMAFSYVSLGSFFYVKQYSGENVSNGIEWIPIVSLVVYAAFYSMGIGPIGMTFLEDRLPNQSTGLLSVIPNSVNWLSAFLVIKTYQDLSNAVANYGCFWFYASVCLVGSLFTLIMVPETKRKNEEIGLQIGNPDFNLVEISRL